jgi:hypothetical protein
VLLKESCTYIPDASKEITMNGDIQTKKRKWESDARVGSAATGFFEALGG